MQNTFRGECNMDNPLGTKCEVLFSYAKLLAQLWNGEETQFNPYNLKRSIGHNNPMFQGMQQHDSQELLNFVLDALHEDLNRVQKKPYVEVTEKGQKTDEEFSAEAWDKHLYRNQSVIVDLLHGQYRSTLQCPVCSRISVTFDPYMNIPIPIPQNFHCTYFFLPYEHSLSKTIQNKLYIKMSDSMSGVK